MRFFEVLTQAIGLLVLEQRVSYRMLQLLLDVDDAALEALKIELIKVKQLAIDQDGEMLVWTGGTAVTSAPALRPSPVVRPAALPIEQPLQSAPSPVKPYAPDAERRQLTVMFCDLADSTTLAGRLDPEDLREVIRAYQATSAEVIHDYEGYIAQHLGDGLLVYFGWPQAHEDDARRAIRSGLDIIEAMHTLNSCLKQDKDVHLAVRIGIHTGLVVVGEMGSGDRLEQLALGEPPNIAARLQALAAPDTVMISGVTARLVHGAFVLADLGVHRLKGVTEPLTVARVLGLRDATSDDKNPVPEAGSVLLGRDEEIGLLRRRWEQSKQGVGQVVLVSGEAGIGKSSLVDALRTHVRQEGHTRITWHCSPYHTHSALYPVIKHIQQLLSYDSDTSPAVKLSKLEEMLRAHSLPLADMVPLIAALLAVPLPAGRYPAPALTPQQQRRQTQDALIAWLLAEAECRPILAVWEDLHWADPSTLELLSQLVGQGPTASMLTVLTFRPEFVPSWPTRSHMTPLTLNSLERPQVEALIRHLTGGKALPAEVVRHIVAKTDGVPLFVEELTKMLLESALLHAEEDRYALTGSLAAVTIPMTLQDSLMARLDRLPTAREVAQLAAVLGREFSYEMLQVLAVVEEPALQHGLAQLVGAELLYQRGRPPQARYVFKHALIQDAAYASILRSTRQRYHQRIAHVLETDFRETAETQPELLAHHYMEAGFGDQAVIYWQRAGQYAIERSAYAEAIGHLSKGLTVLPTLPATAERLQHELHMQLTLGTALMATRGYGAPEVGQTYARAHELCQHGGDKQQHFRALWGLWRFYVVGQEVAQARPLAQQLFALAQQAHDVALLMAANNALGITLFYLGDFTSALSHLEAAMALYNPEQHRALAFIYGQDPGVICYAFAALTLWMLGYPDQALQRSQEALACAQDPFSRAYALFWTALPPQFCGRRHTVYDQADTTIALSAEQGFTLWQAGGMILQGWARTHQGQAEEGKAQVSQGLVNWRATGGKRPQPYLLALLAETYNKTGQTTEGLTVLAEALAEVEHYGERWWEAELHRLTGELLLAQMPRQESEAEACFQRAIDVATGQQAKSLELRATVSLGRLWQHQGKHEPGQQLLEPCYAWFTEGFETADLTEARALLTALVSQQEP